MGNYRCAVLIGTICKSFLSQAQSADIKSDVMVAARTENREKAKECVKKGASVNHVGKATGFTG